MYNLIETVKDESPIIDTKGNIQGKIDYAISFQLFDPDGELINVLDYDTLADLIGNVIKLKVNLKKAIDIPHKWSHISKCKYEWLDDVIHESEHIHKTQNPTYDYEFTHTIPITEEFLSYSMYNTLTIGIWGKAEPKEIDRTKLDYEPTVKKNQDLLDFDDVSRDSRPATKQSIASMKSKDESDRFSELEKQNRELQELLRKERLRTGATTKGACCCCNTCNIF
mmetsp:Transcript_8216/g.5875  ORF Transcript_8216/g.5875 Transcript_8216/m.5875 type:complete len:224 (-) Transcript_8216:77-748(-)